MDSQEQMARMVHQVHVDCQDRMENVDILVFRGIQGWKGQLVKTDLMDHLVFPVCLGQKVKQGRQLLSWYPMKVIRQTQSIHGRWDFYEWMINLNTKGKNTQNKQTNKQTNKHKSKTKQMNKKQLKSLLFNSLYSQRNWFSGRLISVMVSVKLNLIVV